MRKKILAVTFLICLAVTGCGNASQSTNDMVSIEEYNRVVDERDYYKEQYEKIINATDNTTTSSSEYSGETQMTVDITKENLNDYFEFVKISDDNQINSYVFAPKSKVFEDGWVYVATSSDFNISYTCYHKQDPQMGWYNMDRIKNTVGVSESDEPELTILDAHGQILFERKEALKKYEIDTFNLKRIVETSDGKKYSTDIMREQVDILY